MKTNDDREIVFWSHDRECEDLRHETREAAIKVALEENPELRAKIFPLYGFSRISILVPQFLALSFLERLLEELDSLGGGENSTKPTAEMERLADNFVSAVARLYAPWGCEIVHTEYVDNLNKDEINV